MALGEEDELDFFASEQLSLFPALLGADNVTLLCPLFRLLLNLPETPIRDKAVNSFSGIITLFAAVDNTDFLISLASLSLSSKVFCCKHAPLVPLKLETVALVVDLFNDPGYHRRTTKTKSPSPSPTRLHV